MVELNHNVNWYISQFPESLFTCHPDKLKVYASHVMYGRAVMSKGNAVICGIGRDIKRFLPYTISRIERLGQMFNDYKVIIYENDSGDGTIQDLENWRNKNTKVHIISETLNLQKLIGANLERVKHLAYCRNKYMIEIDKINYDYAIVVDLDLIGGFSYEGICHSFGTTGWDVATSNGILYFADNNYVTRMYHDTWPFIQEGLSRDTSKLQKLKFNRGDDIVKVYSAFGGLGIYRHKAINALRYDYYDCEHVTLHDKIREKDGIIVMNPNQIVLYSPTRYNVL